MVAMLAVRRASHATEDLPDPEPVFGREETTGPDDVVAEDEDLPAVVVDPEVDDPSDGLDGETVTTGVAADAVGSTRSDG